jgi:hypothetical protein
MPNTTTKTRVGAKGAVVVARHPTLRRAAAPSAKIGWRVGKVVAKRKVRAQAERVGAAAQTVGALVAVYGPMAVEVFGPVEAPKRRRRVPVFAAGVAIGAGAVYVLNRKDPS